MKIDFKQKLCNLSGVPLNMDGEDLTLVMVCVNALLATYPDERDLPGMEKYARYALSKRIHDKHCDLSAKDIDKIKELIGRQFSALVVGAAFDLLDGKKQPKPMDEKESA